MLPGKTRCRIYCTAGLSGQSDLGASPISLTCFAALDKLFTLLAQLSLTQIKAASWPHALVKEAAGTVQHVVGAKHLLGSFSGNATRGRSLALGTVAQQASAGSSPAL